MLFQGLPFDRESTGIRRLSFSCQKCRILTKTQWPWPLWTCTLVNLQKVWRFQLDCSRLTLCLAGRCTKCFQNRPKLTAKTAFESRPGEASYQFTGQQLRLNKMSIGLLRVRNIVCTDKTNRLLHWRQSSWNSVQNSRYFHRHQLSVLWTDCLQSSNTGGIKITVLKESEAIGSRTCRQSSIDFGAATQTSEDVISSFHKQHQRRRVVVLLRVPRFE